MTQRALPFDGGIGYDEDDWRTMFENILTSGVLRGSLDELEVFGDSTGMNVKVPSGKAWIRGHTYISDAQETLPIANAHATNPRIDRIVLRLDTAANSLILQVLEGAPGVAPAAPPLTQTDATYEISLAQVRVEAAAATIAANKVTTERLFAEPPGASPAGAIKGFGGAVAPDGWLLCNGAAVSRVTFARLFAAIGTAHGAGDGSTTFNVPDGRGRFLLGKAAAGTGDTLGETGGQIDQTVSVPVDPPSTGVSGPSSGVAVSFASPDISVVPYPPAGQSVNIAEFESGESDPITPPYFVGNFIVKV